MGNISFDKIKSRKLWTTASAALVLVLNSKFNLGLDQGTVSSLTWIVIGYVLAQGGVDAVAALKK